MTTDDTPTITEQLIEAVRTTPGAGSGWIARAIGSDDIHTCAALLYKLAKRGALRPKGQSMNCAPVRRPRSMKWPGG